MIEKINANYDAFYYMVLSATALSNSPNGEPDEDIGKIVSFIGEAYGLEKGLIEECKEIILDKLCAIGTDADIAGFYAATEGSIAKEDKLLYQTRVDAIYLLQQISRLQNPSINPSWFLYNNYMPYSPFMRFRELRITASNGLAVCNRLIGIMLFLGIGTKEDRESGIRRLLQCAYWGDICSLHLLRLAYKKAGNKEKEKLFEELIKVSSYLEEGSTVLPKEVEISEEARKQFALISSIKQDIVLGLGIYTINYSFVEIVLMDEVDYLTKMSYINSYRDGNWKEATNPTSPTKGRFGFRIDGEE